MVIGSLQSTSFFSSSLSAPSSVTFPGSSVPFLSVFALPWGLPLTLSVRVPAHFCPSFSLARTSRWSAKEAVGVDLKRSGGHGLSFSMRRWRYLTVRRYATARESTTSERGTTHISHTRTSLYAYGFISIPLGY